jgi:transposase
MKLNEEKWYAGIDLHRKYSHVTIMDKQGYIQSQQRYENSQAEIIPALLACKIPVEAVVESTYGWYWLGDKLEEASIDYFLAHPQKVKAIAGKVKTDERDSKILADLLRCNLLPMSYIPTKDERSIKEILRFRFKLVEQHANVKRRLRDILAKQNLTCSVSDITSPKAKTWFSKQEFKFPYATEIETLLVQSDQLKDHIKKYDQEISSQVEINDSAKLLMTIPGVGKVIALTLVTEIGNIQRFPNPRALASYAGLVPKVSSSGGKTHLGSITRHGNRYIRWALAEAVTHTIKKDRTYKDFYEKLVEKKKVKGKAKVATMNKLLRAIHAMLTKKIPFETNITGVQK